MRTQEIMISHGQSTYFRKIIGEHVIANLAGDHFAAHRRSGSPQQSNGKLENLCYTRAYAHYPLIGHWDLSLLSSRLVVQKAGRGIGESG